MEKGGRETGGLVRLTPLEWHQMALPPHWLLAGGPYLQQGQGTQVPRQRHLPPPALLRPGLCQQPQRLYLGWRWQWETPVPCTALARPEHLRQGSRDWLWGGAEGQ